MCASKSVILHSYTSFWLKQLFLFFVLSCKMFLTDHFRCSGSVLEDLSWQIIRFRTTGHVSVEYVVMVLSHVSLGFVFFYF